LVCVTPSHCIPWDAACFYAKAYCIDGQGSSCGAVGHLCGRREDGNWCGENQVWERCWSKQPNCDPQCGSLDLPPNCAAEAASCQASRCLCKPGYRRAANNSCLPAYKCQRCRWVHTRDAIPVTSAETPKLVGEKLKTLPHSSDRRAKQECRLISGCSLIVSLPFNNVHLLLAASSAHLANLTASPRLNFSFHRKVCTLL
jgi:hypothetical protein